MAGKALRAYGVPWAYMLDPELGSVTPADSRLGDAVEMIMLAVRTWALRFGSEDLGEWERAACLAGRLLSGPPALPP